MNLAKTLGLVKPNPKKGNCIILNYEKLERRMALLESGTVNEYSVEREGDVNIVGGIFKGTVKNIEQGLKAMFVDIGLDKNAFLHFWDALPAALDGSMEEVSRSSKKQKKPKLRAQDIPKIYPKGSEIIIQVSKGGIGNKGPRVTTNISLAGRYLVLTPYSEQFGISKKIESPAERKRLRKIIQKLDLPEGMGLIFRTGAQRQNAKHFIRDLAMLLDQWNQVEDLKQSKKSPACLYSEPNMLERSAQRLLTDDIDSIFCDDEATVDQIKSIVGKISRRAKSKVHYHPTKDNIFEEIGIHKQIEGVFSRQVWLPCGGYIVIDETEALISIDINTGRNKGDKNNNEKTILQTNLESAVEIAHQLKLRNIGGLVVIDFIDMRSRRDQLAVYKAIKDELKKDRAKTQVLQISRLGLMEMTRQRLNESLQDTLYDPCPYCHGKGKVKNLMSMSVEIQRDIHTLINRNEGQWGDVIIVINSEILNRFKNEDSALLGELERQHTGRLIFRSAPHLQREQYSILDAKTEQPIDVHRSLRKK